MYNSEPFIEQTVRNILSGGIDTQKFEIILIDDGSKDKTKDICLSKFRDCKNVFLYCKKNGGIADSRNYGIEKAKGKFLFFHDHDDLLVVKNMAKIISVLEKTESDLLIFETQSLRKNNTEQLCVVNGDFAEKQLSLDDKTALFKTLFFIQDKTNAADFPVSRFGHIWSTIIKREFVKKNNIKFVIRCDYEDDFSFLLEMLCVPSCCVSCHKILIYQWAIREESESHILRFDVNFMDRVENYNNYLCQRIENSAYSSYKLQAISNIVWRKTRDFLLLFGRGDNDDKTYKNFLFFCKKYSIRDKMIRKTFFRKTRNQRLLSTLFFLRFFRVCYKIIMK